MKTTSPFLGEAQNGVFQHCPRWVSQMVRLTALAYKKFFYQALLHYCLWKQNNNLDFITYIDGDGNLQFIFDIFKSP